MARNHKIDARAVLDRAQREGPDSLIGRGEAAAVLDLLLAGNSSYERRKQIGNQIDAAMRPRGNRGRIPSMEHKAAAITVGDLAHWATDLYGQGLDDLPRRPRHRTLAVAIGDVGVISDGTTMEVYPGTTERCHAEMRLMYAEIETLRQELAALSQQLASKEQEFKDRQTARFRKK